MSKFSNNSLAVMFPGQGKLMPGMGKDAFDNSPEAQKIFEEASLAAGVNMARICFGDMTDKLPMYPQMALAAASLSELELAKQKGLTEPDVYMGLSAGEMTALAAAGGFVTRAAAFSAIKAREDAMAKAGEVFPGRMVAILGISVDHAKQIADRSRTFLAGGITPTMHNFSGDIHLGERLEHALEWLKEQGEIIKARVIPMSEDVPPAHSDLQLPAKEGFSAALLMLRDLNMLQPPGNKFFSNSAEFLQTTQQVVDYLVGQLTNGIDLPKQFAAISRLGIRNYFECGPGDSMTKAALNNLKGAIVINRHFGKVVHIEKIAPDSD